MRNYSVYLGGSVLLLSLMLTTGFRPVVRPACSANGQGGLSFNGAMQHFAFHAMKHANGKISGSWESYSAGVDNRTHGKITCFTVLPDGKTAILSGIITQKEGTGFTWFGVGDPIWFKVQDNGEGFGVQDLFSDYYMGTSGCIDYGNALLPIENGNIQVKVY